MLRHIKASCCVFGLSLLILGLAYPLFVWAIGRVFFPWKAAGSPIFMDGKIIGLRNIGQHFVAPGYLWSRPSAVPDHHLVISGGSNLSWSSPRLRADVEKRIRLFQDRSVPVDLIMASASGYDPDISIEAALFQLPRIAATRKVAIDDLKTLLLSNEEFSFQGLFPARVNVLLFNIMLDKRFPIPPEAQAASE
jgi:K+-transporting ATPase ATPase C chain